MNLVRRSVRLRLTLWYGAALSVVILSFAAGVYALVAWSFHRQGVHQLDDALKTVRQAYDDGGDELEEIDHHGSVTHFHVAAGGSVIYQSDAWRHNQLAMTTANSAQGDSAHFKAPSGEPFLVRTILVPGLQPPVELSAAISQRMPQQSLQTVAVMLLVGLPIAIIGAAIGGYWLAGRALSPVVAITDKAREITAERLDERLPVVHPEDEFGQLATVVNELLARLGDSFDRLRRFTSDASHELRTPLTAIRSVGEVALHDNIPPAQYREVIGSMLEEADRLSRLLDTLLTLTRADNDEIAVKRERVDVTKLARDVCDLLHSVAEEREQVLGLETTSPLYVDSDPNLLRQALINLLDNAVKYTQVGGTIRVRAFLSAGDEVVIEVNDSGPGIAVEHHRKVFDRFYRVDKARSRETGGAGLGLAIAKWAVEVNRGRVELVSEVGRGCTFRIVLPGETALQRDQELIHVGSHQIEGVKS